jgi:DNA-binding response OmpR family regulator
VALTQSDLKQADALSVLLVGGTAPDTAGLCTACIETGLTALRSSDPEVIAHAVVTRHPEVVVIDLRNDDWLSDRILQWICRDASCSALVITQLSEVETRLRVIEMSGLVDHLIAPFDSREGCARVRTLLARGRRERTARVDAGDLQLEVAQRSVERGGERVALTPREIDVLLALVECEGQPVSKRDLLARVWHGEARSENVVEANVSSLRRKLHALGPPLIHTVHRTGYVFRPVPPSPLQRAPRSAQNGIRELPDRTTLSGAATR